MLVNMCELRPWPRPGCGWIGGRFGGSGIRGFPLLVDSSCVATNSFLAPEAQCVRGGVVGGVLMVHHFGCSGQSGVEGTHHGVAALRHPLALTVESLAPPADQYSHLVDLRRSALASRILVFGGSSLLLPSGAHHRAAERPETRLPQSL